MRDGYRLPIAWVECGKNKSRFISMRHRGFYCLWVTLCDNYGCLMLIGCCWMEAAAWRSLLMTFAWELVHVFVLFCFVLLSWRELVKLSQFYESRYNDLVKAAVITVKGIMEQHANVTDVVKINKVTNRKKKIISSKKTRTQCVGKHDVIKDS